MLSLDGQFWVLLLFFVVTGYSADDTVTSNPNEIRLQTVRKLRDDLLSDYERDSRSVQSHINATVVTVGMSLLSLHIDEARSVLTVNAWPTLEWRDDFLRWDPKVYADINEIGIASYRLWIPDIIVFYNNGYTDLHVYGDTYARVNSSGFIRWTPPSYFQVYCSVDLRKWPFDRQQCQLLMSSWAHEGYQIDLRIKGKKDYDLKLDSYEPIREWTLEGGECELKTKQFEDFNNTYTYIEYTLHLVRNSSSLAITIIGPAVGLIILALLAFWLSPLSAERLYLNLANVFIAIAYLQYLGRLLPNNGDNTPLIVLFFRDSLIMIGISVILTVISRQLADSATLSVPDFAVNVIKSGSWSSRLMCLQLYSSSEKVTLAKLDDADKETDADGAQLLDALPDPTAASIKKREWLQFVSLLDRLAFLIYLIVFAVFASVML